MAEVIRDWAGKERLFRLDLGGVMQVEEACGGEGIGAIFLRLSSGKFRAHEVHSILRLALIGGGENKVSAKLLLDKHFDLIPYAENAAMAGEIMMALMMGIEEGAAGEVGEPAPIKFSEIAQICRVFNMSPHDLKALTYAEFVNLVAGFNAASSPQKAEPPSEEEFEAILAKYEPEALK